LLPELHLRLLGGIKSGLGGACEGRSYRGVGLLVVGANGAARDGCGDYECHDNTRDSLVRPNVCLVTHFNEPPGKEWPPGSFPCPSPDSACSSAGSTRRTRESGAARRR